jgi:transposase-like protein
MCGQKGRSSRKPFMSSLGWTWKGSGTFLDVYQENERAKFWLTVFNNLKNRGVADMHIVSVDGLTGFPDEIEAVYPTTEIQK